VSNCTDRQLNTKIGLQNEDKMLSYFCLLTIGHTAVLRTACKHKRQHCIVLVDAVEDLGIH